MFVVQALHELGDLLGAGSGEPAGDLGESLQRPQPAPVSGHLRGSAMALITGPDGRDRGGDPHPDLQRAQPEVLASTERVEGGRRCSVRPPRRGELAEHGRDGRAGLITGPVAIVHDLLDVRAIVPLTMAAAARQSRLRNGTSTAIAVRSRSAASSAVAVRPSEPAMTCPRFAVRDTTGDASGRSRASRSSALGGANLAPEQGDQPLGEQLVGRSAAEHVGVGQRPAAHGIAERGDPRQRRRARAGRATTPG